MQQISLVNGKRAAVDPRDRGLAYGDGVFETMACRGGHIRWLDHHLDRLILGCGRLAIPAPARAVLRSEIEAHCPRNEAAVVKLIVTRGVGARGYRAPEPAEPTRILTIGPWPDLPPDQYTRGIVVKTCALRLGENPQLAGLKHLCRLEQVLAQMEIEGTPAQEGLVRSSSGYVIGGISSNVFGDGGLGFGTRGRERSRLVWRGQGIAAQRRRDGGAGCFARCAARGLRRQRGLGRRADDFAFDQNVVRAADHDEMFDIVAADENEAAARIDGERVEHAETRLAGAAAVRQRQPAAGEAAQTHESDGNQRKNDAEGYGESHRDRQFGAKNRFHAYYPT